MKWWVWLLAVLVLVAFGTLSMVYVQTYVTERPDGIILFVANGLDLNLLQKARQQALARGASLQIDRLNKIASLDVKGVGQLVPDEAAATTALATGKRVQNGYYGINAQGQRLNTLIYAAEKAGRATGLITTSELSLPTAASFYGRGKGLPGEYLQNAADLVDSSKINIILGGGGEYFSPASVVNEAGRRDGRSLFAEAEKRGYQLVRNAQELDQLPVWRQRWVFGLFAQKQFVFSTLRDQQTVMPTLEMMTRQSIRCLQNYIVKNDINIHNIRGGYFLVIDHGLVATAARNNWTQAALDEVAELDAAVGTALAYAGPKSLVLVTNNFNLGALESYRDEAQNLPPAPGVVPPINYEWLTGPGGIPSSQSDKNWLLSSYRSGLFSNVRGELKNPSPAVHFSRQAGITNGPAWLASSGQDSSHFTGFLNNTDLYELLLKEFY